MKIFLFRIIAIVMAFSVLSLNCICGSVVKENENVNPNFKVEECAAGNKMPVTIKAKSAVLMDAESGKIILEYNGDKKLYPASVTKIMTILLVCESIENGKISLKDKVSCSDNAASKGGSQIWLESGETMTVDELLRATVIGSANDAATLLGEYISGSEEAFIKLMNDKAKKLKMNNTKFMNPTGLDDETDEHLTTAKDIAIMSRELLKYDFIEKYTTVWMDELRNGKTELVNTNKLVRFYKGTTGLKTGTTSKAGCCISASAKRDDLHLIAVVLGSSNSKDRFNTAKALLDYGFSNYSSFTPTIGKNELEPIKVIGGRENFINPKIPDMSAILIKKGEENKIKVEINLSQELKAPVVKNQVIGEIILKNDKKIICEYKVYADKSIKKLSFFDAFTILANFICNGETKYPVKT